MNGTLDNYDTLTNPWSIMTTTPISSEDRLNRTLNSEEYCGPRLKAFANIYVTMDVYIASAVCISGVITNIFNIRVFTQKSMRSCPTNQILTALAISDLLCVLRKLERIVLQYYFGQKSVIRHHRAYSSIAFATFDTVNIILYALFHTWSIYLTLLVGLWRLLGVLYPLKSRRWLTVWWTKVAILSTIFVSTALFPLGFLGLHMDRLNGSRVDMRVETGYQLLENEEYFESVQDYYGRVLLLIMFTVFMKIIPCAVMTFVTFGLIWSLSSAKKRRRQLLCKEDSSFEIQEPNAPPPPSPVYRKSVGNMSRTSQISLTHSVDSSADRTTKILIIVLLIFVLTEFPFCILVLDMLTLSMNSGMNFLDECQFTLSLLFTLMEYISTTTSFFVYYIMSKRFRQGFTQICCGEVKEREERGGAREGQDFDCLGRTYIKRLYSRPSNPNLPNTREELKSEDVESSTKNTTNSDLATQVDFDSAQTME